MQLDITGIKPAEILFAFSQDQQMDSRSGCIGLLQGRFGAGQEVYTDWADRQSQFKTHEFGVELNKVIHALRAEGGCGLLADRRRMTEFCAHHPETALGSGCEAEYGVKNSGRQAGPTCCAATRVRAKSTSISMPTKRRCWNTAWNALPGSVLRRSTPVVKHGKQNQTMFACLHCFSYRWQTVQASSLGGMHKDHSLY